jgi:hypothetical protein
MNPAAKQHWIPGVMSTLKEHACCHPVKRQANRRTIRWRHFLPFRPSCRLLEAIVGSACILGRYLTDRI